jgi:hypothetical protein
MQPPDEKTPEEGLSDDISQTFFGVGPDPAERRGTIRRLLVSAVICAGLVPILYDLKFGVVDGLGWGITVFFVVYCLLAAVGLYFGPRREFHTPVRLKGDWIDRVGAFWLVACVFGPFFGYVLTAVFPITVVSWRWAYGLRFFLGAGLPVLTALPMVRYLRGKAVWVALPILLGVTMLAIWSVVNVGRDLWAGPVIQQAQPGGPVELLLRFTGRRLEAGGR